MLLQAFTRQDLKRFEYAEDLETYYKFGYGSPTNRKIGCPLVKELVDFFTKHVENGKNFNLIHTRMIIIDI